MTRKDGMGALALSVAILAAAGAAAGPADPASRPAGGGPRARLRAELTTLPYEIVYESFRGKSWELMVVNADGSGRVKLTDTPDVHELYPHVSPDGSRICFVADEGTGRAMVRSVYTMDVDFSAAGRPAGGAARKLVARNARQPCWKPEGLSIAYVKGEYTRFTYNSYGTKGLFFYDLAAGRYRRHADPKILHVCHLCWAPGGKWVLATVHGGLGYGHANLAIEADGTKLFKLPAVNGCRPDVSGDGKRILWNATDQIIAIADLDPTARPPGVRNVRTLVRCGRSHKMYHGDFSPDGRHVAFSYGPAGGAQHVGGKAPGWNICIADGSARNVWVAVTDDGASNKEPDWIPVGRRKEK